MSVIPYWFDEASLEFHPQWEWTQGELVPHPEVPDRARAISAALAADPRFERRKSKPATDRQVRGVHAKGMVDLYVRAPDKTLYPSVFWRGSPAAEVGAFCYDTGTPLDRRAIAGAFASAGAALEAARAIAKGAPLAYALARPPGHHAGRSFFGGYSYVNSAALAARLLAKIAPVAVLDLDFHHGNGTEDVFHQNPRVLTVSLHADPVRWYPTYWGFESNEGRGAGLGKNANFVVADRCGIGDYLAKLRSALEVVRRFAPSAIVLPIGFDGYEHDPLGHFALRAEDYHAIGAEVGALGLPIVAVQEGGYAIDALGACAVEFLGGLARRHT
jgi:acetoin utilization deacetylase AcuC-like enzyme